MVLDNAEDRKMVEVKMDDGRKEKQLLYYDGETISGKASVPIQDGHISDMKMCRFRAILPHCPAHSSNALSLSLSCRSESVYESPA